MLFSSSFLKPFLCFIKITVYIKNTKIKITPSILESSLPTNIRIKGNNDIKNIYMLSFLIVLLFIFIPLASNTGIPIIIVKFAILLPITLPKAIAGCL